MEGTNFPEVRESDFNFTSYFKALNSFIPCIHAHIASIWESILVKRKLKESKSHEPNTISRRSDH
jgi:hypothetical protein